VDFENTEKKVHHPKGRRVKRDFDCGFPGTKKGRSRSWSGQGPKWWGEAVSLWSGGEKKGQGVKRWALLRVKRPATRRPTKDQGGSFNISQCKGEKWTPRRVLAPGLATSKLLGRGKKGGPPTWATSWSHCLGGTVVGGT